MKKAEAVDFISHPLLFFPESNIKITDSRHKSGLSYISLMCQANGILTFQSQKYLIPRLTGGGDSNPRIYCWK